MTITEIRSVIQELINEIKEGELRNYGVKDSNGHVSYKIKAKNPRHASEKIESLFGVKIDFRNFQLISPCKNNKKFRRSMDRAIFQMSSSRREKRKLLRYKQFFKEPLESLFRVILKPEVDVNNIIDKKYFKIIQLNNIYPANIGIPAHRDVEGNIYYRFNCSIQIPTLYFKPEIINILQKNPNFFKRPYDKDFKWPYNKEIIDRIDINFRFLSPKLIELIYTTWLTDEQLIDEPQSSTTKINEEIEKDEKTEEEVYNYLHFVHPFSVAITELLKTSIDPKEAIKRKLFKIIRANSIKDSQSHSDGYPLKYLAYNIQIPTMYFDPIVLQKIKSDPDGWKRTEAILGDHMRIMCDFCQLAKISFRELSPKLINVFFQNAKRVHPSDFNS